MDQLLALGHVVVGVLAVPGRPPARLEEGITGQVPRGGVLLEIGEEPEVRVGGGGRVGKVEPGQGHAVEAVDLPVQAGRGRAPAGSAQGAGSAG